ncbi:hypothetical protein SAMN05880582_10197 [Rhizobium sp. RU20A]|uniref:hypothetical protein n=1 Tax=Rhizobium sp. RU20A TaxID=1907412 RepID=UPI000953DCC6|nr:hypothetical protein [Rhizobium sp. RU20A]SIP94029.1 hypothetical protein SAMN05880582_10197 [Rhizobium sp. RU20A]
MVQRKPGITSAPYRPALEALLERARTTGVSDEQLQEQRVSFAYGNAPDGSRITKDSVRVAAKSPRLRKA